MSENKVLDFCVIGAQKAATTTIYKWLSCHPNVYIPFEKEAPFFYIDQIYKRGWDAFFVDYFSDARCADKCGTVSPQYFGNCIVPRRIAQLFPGIKLIVILRDPIERAFSHYQMEVRSRRESRSFFTAISELLKEEGLTLARKKRDRFDPVKCYITFGEYGYQLQNWLKYFPIDQFLFLDFSEVADIPEDVCERICNFLEIDASFKPMNLTKKFHEGGGATWLPPTSYFRKFFLFRLIRRLISDRVYRKFAFWYKISNVRRQAKNEKIDNASRELLISHFQSDADLFMCLTGRELPWPWLKK